jgi:hypothetical protein
MTSASATFIAVCLGLLVLEIGLILAAVVFLALRLSKAVAAVESVAHGIEDKVASFKSSWARAFQGAGSLLMGAWGSRRKHARHADGEPAGRY